MKVALTDIRYTAKGDDYLSQLVPRLVDRGHEVHVYCRAWDDSVDARAHMHRIPNRWKRIDFMKAWSYDRWLSRKVRRSSFDLVHGLAGSSQQDITSDRTSDPLLDAQPDRLQVEEQTKGLHRRQLQAIEERRFRRGNFQRVVASSRLAARRLRERHGLTDGDVETIHNGVDTTRFSPRNRELYRAEYRDRIVVPQEAFVALSIGHGFVGKGVPTIIEAARIIRERGGLPCGRRFRVAVVGAERQKVEQGLVRLSREHGVSGDVKFYGPQELIERWHALADVLVHPSRFDRFGDVVLEAMATGVPPLVSALAGASELVEDGVSGVVLQDPTDAAALADHIVALASAPERLEAMGRAARRTAEGHTWDRHVEQVLALYDQVAAQKQGRAAAR